MLLNELDDATTDQLLPIMRKSISIVTGITQMIENPDTAMNLGASLPFDLTKLPPGVDVFTMLSMAPQAQRDQIATQIDGVIGTVGETMLNQVAVTGVRSEYGALGADIGKNTDQLHLARRRFDGIGIAPGGCLYHFSRFYCCPDLSWFCT